MLDEPTVGVDPLSRRELWEIIFRLVNEQGLRVLLSTSYLDEAEHCGHVVVMHQGKVLAQGAPGEISQLAAGSILSCRPSRRQSRRESFRRVYSTSRRSSMPCRSAARCDLFARLTNMPPATSGGSDKPSTDALSRARRQRCGAAFRGWLHGVVAPNRSALRESRAI